MIRYKARKFKEFNGEYLARITAVDVRDNSYFAADKENSTETVFDITFDIEDPTTLDVTPFTQKFVAPLTGGKSLFQQLLDVKQFLPDEDEGDFDEQSLIGLKVRLKIGKNKKGYSTVETVESVNKSAVQEDELVAEDDLPF